MQHNLAGVGEDSGQPFRIHLATPVIGEEEVEAVREVLMSGVLTNGPVTRRFEEQFAERHQLEHSVAFANGTVALTAIYLGLGIGPADEVIVPSMTFISSATSVLHTGAEVVFADIDPDTFNLDPEDAARRITQRTKAILAAHYGGQPADLEELRQVADEAGVHLIEDAAQAHGATYRGRPVGGFGSAAMFSFTPTKNVTTGEGGIVVTNRGDLAQGLRLLRNHGQTTLYQHEILGYNWRMTEMQAALGCVQMGKLNGILQRKLSNADWMRTRLSCLSSLALPTARPDRTHTYMLYTLKPSQDRDALLQHLTSQRIESRIYFPPAHQQPLFNGISTHLPITEDIAARLLSIPFHSNLSLAELEALSTSLADGLQ